MKAKVWDLLVKTNALSWFNRFFYVTGLFIGFVLVGFWAGYMLGMSLVPGELTTFAFRVIGVVGILYVLRAGLYLHYAEEIGWDALKVELRNTLIAFGVIVFVFVFSDGSWAALVAGVFGFFMAFDDIDQLLADVLAVLRFAKGLIPAGSGEKKEKKVLDFRSIGASLPKFGKKSGKGKLATPADILGTPASHYAPAHAEPKAEGTPDDGSEEDSGDWDDSGDDSVRCSYTDPETHERCENMVEKSDPGYDEKKPRCAEHRRPNRS
jgi:hypothetical protein